MYSMDVWMVRMKGQKNPGCHFVYHVFTCSNNILIVRKKKVPIALVNRIGSP